MGSRSTPVLAPGIARGMMRFGLPRLPTCGMNFDENHTRCASAGRGAGGRARGLTPRARARHGERLRAHSRTLATVYRKAQNPAGFARVWKHVPMPTGDRNSGASLLVAGDAAMAGDAFLRSSKAEKTARRTCVSEYSP